jgi:hypothetical protein
MGPVLGERPLLVGVGGGGDVAGAYVAARVLGLQSFCLGGFTWESRLRDPSRGPRVVSEYANVTLIDDCGALARPGAGVPKLPTSAEGRMSEWMGGAAVALIDPGEGPPCAADSIVAAAEALACDQIVLIDVGGDMLAQGDERCLTSPLCDAIGLAAALHIRQATAPLLAGVLGPGCDAELTEAEVDKRCASLVDAGCSAYQLPLEANLEEFGSCASAVLSEATGLVVACGEGANDVHLFRGERPVQLSPSKARLIVFDGQRLARMSPLARSIADCGSIEHAAEQFASAGVPVELGPRWEASPERRELRARRRRNA